MPTFSGRLHLPTTPVADALRFLDDPTLSWAPRPPAPGEKDLRELSGARIKTPKLIQAASRRKDPPAALYLGYAEETQEDLALIDKLQQFHTALSSGTTPSSEEVNHYLEVSVLPKFHDEVYASLLDQTLAWARQSQFSFAGSIADELESYRNNLNVPPENPEMLPRLRFTPEERRFYRSVLEPAFAPFISGIEDGHAGNTAYTAPEMVDIASAGWERMRAIHGDLLDNWNFRLRQGSVVSTKNSTSELLFGRDATRDSDTCRETFVHEGMHILQSLWGREQEPDIGTIMAEGPAGSQAFREAWPALMGKTFGKDRGTTWRYHLAVGMALGKGRERPATIREIGHILQHVAALELEQDALSAGKQLNDADALSQAKGNTARILDRIFKLPELPGDGIVALPLGADLKYANGAATAVEQARLLRPDVEQGSFDAFARLICGKWDPSNALLKSVVEAYPTPPERYAAFFTPGQNS